MKIENTVNVQMLHKGTMENSKKYMQAKEVERAKEAVDTKQSVSSFLQNKGVYFDEKA